MKKIFILLVCVMVCFLASCEEEISLLDIDYERSYADEESSWKPSLLSKAGLDHIIEPEGEKVFTEYENGDFSFTVTPADQTTFAALSSTVFSQLSNVGDKITPVSYAEAKDSETHFGISYKLGLKTVVIEMNWSENIITTSVTFK